MRIGRGNRSTRRKPAPVPPCSPQNPHDLTVLGPGPPPWETNRLSYGAAQCSIFFFDVMSDGGKVFVYIVLCSVQGTTSC
jgi:hypothetical protein